MKMKETKQLPQQKQRALGSLCELVKLKKLVGKRSNCDSLPKSVLDLGNNWATIPARASHFGGFGKQLSSHSNNTSKRVLEKQLDCNYMKCTPLRVILKPS